MGKLNVFPEGDSFLLGGQKLKVLLGAEGACTALGLQPGPYCLSLSGRQHYLSTHKVEAMGFIFEKKEHSNRHHPANHRKEMFEVENTRINYRREYPSLKGLGSVAHHPVRS